MNTHRNYLQKCLLEKKNWMKLSYTKEYEEKNNINSCPVPQFTFKNNLNLFGSPVLDTYFNGFNDNKNHLKNVVKGLQNNYHCIINNN